MKNITEKAVKQIKKEHMKPVSKWKFVLRGVLWWIAFSLTIIFGAVSLAIAIFLVRELDWDVYEHAGHSLLEFLIISIPHFWVIFVVTFVVVSYRNFRHTKRGYRYKSFAILGIVLGTSFVLGFIISSFGVSGALNEAFVEKVPGYQNIIQTKEGQWSQPEKGLLAGEVIEANNEKEILLKDFDGEKWRINVSKDTVIRGVVVLRESEKIKVIGKQEEDENVFSAKEIRTWEGKGKRKVKQSHDMEGQGRGMRGK